MITLRYRLKDLKVQAVEQSFKDGNTEFPAGSFIVNVNQSGKDVHKLVRAAVERSGLTAVGARKFAKRADA